MTDLEKYLKGRIRACYNEIKYLEEQDIWYGLAYELLEKEIKDCQSKLDELKDMK